MQRYEIFKRTWWRLNKNYPNGLEPHAGRRTHVAYCYGLDEARKKCEYYNRTDEYVRKSKTGLKYEFRAA